jgi:hypothetical protein
VVFRVGDDQRAQWFSEYVTIIGKNHQPAWAIKADGRTLPVGNA